MNRTLSLVLGVRIGGLALLAALATGIVGCSSIRETVVHAGSTEPAPEVAPETTPGAPASISVAPASISVAPEPAPVSRRLRIMSYNVRHSLGLDGKLDYQRIADIINALEPDVVGLQEVDVGTSRTNGVDGLRELARLTGLNGYFSEAIEFQGGKYGIGVLSRKPAVRVDSQALPGREEARTLIAVDFGDYIVINTHLSLNAADRAESAAMINAFADRMRQGRRGPLFLCGDFNEPSKDSETFAVLARQWSTISSDEHTFNSVNPDLRLDYVMADRTRQVSVVDAAAVTHVRIPSTSVASDHLPIFVDVLLDGM